MSVSEWLSGRVFQFVHGNNLVYNTCWEDPRLDRQALKLTDKDNVLVITSAGCNALDYALEGPQQIHAVDMNPRQNALLELKISAIRNLPFEQFFRMFGQGQLPGVREIYGGQLRDGLSAWSQQYWDRHIRFFDNPASPFYFRGTSGGFARLINIYVDRVIRVRPIIEDLLSASSVEQQREIYDNQLRDRFWTKSLRFAMGRDTTLSLLGVPRAQRQQVERDYEGGIVKFVQDSVEAVCAKLPIADNYFWRVYMTGSYTPECCPEYLREENYERLRDGLVDRIQIHTNSVQGFLDSNPVPISRFILLDHMDWLSTHAFPQLEAEWQSILRRATPDARVLWRSGGLRTDFVDRVQVLANGQMQPLSQLLTYDKDLASRLHEVDRVHTYGSFYIADLAA